MSRIYTVREITSAVKGVLESEFPFVWVRGQVSNLSRPASGHIYFSLKDEDAVLAVVWFRGSQGAGEAGIHPLTGEVVEPGPGARLAATLANGQEVLCGGPLNVYPPRGSYQLRAELVQDVGRGRLWQEFEELKRRLGAEGFFDPERKRPLPRHPERVAVVTALSGAAIRDFLRLAAERGRGASIRIHPALVQGDEAPASIVRAMDEVRKQNWAEVVVLIRGGGSLEDLWAFNTEPVARAVFASPIPVVAGIGHEVDVSMADMTADARAATPSHAAQLLWPERGVLAQEVDELQVRLDRAWDAHQQRLENGLAALERALAWLSPAQALARTGERLAESLSRLLRAGSFLLERRQGVLDAHIERLSRAFGPEALDARARDLDGLADRLDRAGRELVRGREAALERLSLKLDGLDPERPLERGYSLVRVAATGRFLRGAGDVSAGDELEIKVRDGRVDARVTGARKDE